MSKRTIVRPLVLSLAGVMAAFAGTHAARADVVAQYPFTGGSTASTDTAAHSAAGAFALGSGADPAHWGFSSATNTAFARSDNTPDTEGGAVSGNSYFTFTITPDSGYILDLSNFSIDLGSTDTDNGSITANMAIRSSVDGFASDLLTGSRKTQGLNVTGWSTFSNPTLGTDYSAITAPVVFRIYIWDSRNANPEIDRIDNVTVNGTAVTAIPTPAAVPAGLALMGGLFLFRRHG